MREKIFFFLIDPLNAVAIAASFLLFQLTLPFTSKFIIHLINANVTTLMLKTPILLIMPLIILFAIIIVNLYLVRVLYALVILTIRFVRRIFHS